MTAISVRSLYHSIVNHIDRQCVPLTDVLEAISLAAAEFDDRLDKRKVNWNFGDPIDQVTFD